MNSQQELIIMVGLPRSGKSTYVKTTYGQLNNYKIYELDEYRIKITGKIYEEDAEPYVWDEVRNLIANDITQGYSVVIDECNPFIGNINFWAVLNNTTKNIKCKVIKFNTDIDVCLSRLKDYNKFLSHVIKRKAGIMDSDDKVQEFCRNNNIEFIQINSSENTVN